MAKSKPVTTTATEKGTASAPVTPGAELGLAPDASPTRRGGRKAREDERKVADLFDAWRSAMRAYAGNTEMLKMAREAGWSYAVERAQADQDDLTQRILKGRAPASPQGGADARDVYIVRQIFVALIEFWNPAAPRTPGGEKTFHTLVAHVDSTHLRRLAGYMSKRPADLLRALAHFNLVPSVDGANALTASLMNTSSSTVKRRCQTAASTYEIAAKVFVIGEKAGLPIYGLATAPASDPAPTRWLPLNALTKFAKSEPDE